MCGIGGIILYNGERVRPEVLEAMGNAMAYRGPDGHGIFSEGGVGLCHRRLAIIDVEGGVQPMRDGDLAIVYNGEVYNYQELQQEIGGEFKTESDTEVVLRAYRKWGIDCLSHFMGMFAFALYDPAERKVFLARDRVGIKPLYYAHNHEHLVFASELGALFRSGRVVPHVRPESVAEYLRHQYVPGARTFYSDAFKLLPGHYLELDIDTGRASTRCYWRLTAGIEERTEESWHEELDATLDTIMRMIVRSDVPFGCFLSGGTDSSLVAALMGRVLTEPVKTFTIGFAEEETSELPFAREAAERIGSDHWERVVSPVMAMDVIERLAGHFGEPFGDASAVPTWYVSREAAANVKMVLSGDGGDELFGGYTSYEQVFCKMQGPSHPLLMAILRRVARFVFFAGIRERLAARTITLRDCQDNARITFPDRDLKDLLQPGMPIPPVFRPRFRLNGTIDPLTRFMAEDVLTYLVDDVLTKVDRMSMAHSLEVRVPLLDHTLVELAFRVPSSLKLRLDAASGEVVTKYLLKRSAARFFPDPFLVRPKMGFGIPVVQWCRGPLAKAISEELADSSHPVYTWLSFKGTAALLKDFYGPRPDYVARLWFVFMMAVWARIVYRI